MGVAQQKLTRNQDKYTRISKILVSVKAGIQHLYEKLDCVNVLYSILINNYLVSSATFGSNQR